MKFNHINVHNLQELIPSWAINPVVLARTLDRLFSSDELRCLLPRGDGIYHSLGFWIEVDATSLPQTVRVCTPDDDVNMNGHLIVTCSSVLNEIAQIDVPLNPIFKGYENLAGAYLVYMHSFQTEVPLGYIGMTKQRWFDRLAQHVSSARTGSSLLFHQALRQHQSASILHKIFMCELDHENALDREEEWVGMFSLYPLGLNMIPGGRAGFTYLAKLGLKAKTAEVRDVLIEQFASRDSIDGRPNPLCAARWATDTSFVERVICGHSGRLSVDQVRLIRLGSSLGKSLTMLSKEVSARNLRQVQNVLAGRTYARIKSND